MDKPKGDLVFKLWSIVSGEFVFHRLNQGQGKWKGLWRGSGGGGVGQGQPPGRGLSSDYQQISGWADRAGGQQTAKLP